MNSVPEKSASPAASSETTEDASSAERTKFFKDFAYIVKQALRLESVRPGTFRSVQLWTPAAQRTVYGGQLVAHTVEAAYRTVAAEHMFIHSLHMSFISAGSSSEGSGPIEYTVEALRDGRSFCVRQVRATQDGRTLLLAVAGFHKAEAPGVKHELALPHFCRRLAPATRTDAFAARLGELLAEQTVPQEEEEEDGALALPKPVAARVQYLNLAAMGSAAEAVRSSAAQDVWICLGKDSFALLAAESGIPLSRLHLIVSCWLSDVVVALAALVPHGLPNPNLRMIASLCHSIFFHNPQRVRVDEWFAYEVRSSWAGNNRGLNHGRMYGRDGRLWMSVAQETVMRMRSGYVSKL